MPIEPAKCEACGQLVIVGTTGTRQVVLQSRSHPDGIYSVREIPGQLPFISQLSIAKRFGRRDLRLLHACRRKGRR